VSKSIIVLISCALAFSPITGNPQATLSRQQKTERLNALLREVSLPPIVYTDSAKLIENVAAYRAWAMADYTAKAIPSPTPSESLKTPPSGSEQIARALYPNLGMRYLRASPSKTEVIQQPRTIVEQQGATTIAVGNPDPLLVRYTQTTTWADVVHSVADIHDQAKAFTDAKFQPPQEGMICNYHVTSPATVTKHVSNSRVANGDGTKRFVDCLLQEGASRRWGRLLGGVKTQVSFGQNPQIQQGFNVSGTTAATNNYFASGEADFDPKGLFLNGTDWNNAYETAKAYDSVTPKIGTGVMDELLSRVESTCSDVAAEKDLRSSVCLRKISGLSGWHVLAVFLPQASAVIRNQFDYVKAGGILVAAPFPTKSLADVTFTMDLSRIIPTNKQREDAFKMLDALQKSKNERAKVLQSRLPVQKRVSLSSTSLDSRLDVVRLYADFASEPEKIDDNGWYEKFRGALCNILVARSSQMLLHASSE
jgi:hypothetical protein